MTIWQGACIVHATFPASAYGRALRTSAGHLQRIPKPRRHLRQADFIDRRPPLLIGVPNSARRVLIMTESGCVFARKTITWQKFYFVANENAIVASAIHENEHAGKMRTVSNVPPRIELPAEIIERARVPLDRHACRK